jgi:branched-chain amino acid transport system ATP-binding protein
VTGLTPDKLAARGLSRTFQNLQIFQRMTAAENVMVGRHLRERCNLLADMFRLPSVTRQNSETREAALALLDGVGRKAARMFPQARCPMGPANVSKSPVRWRQNRACCCSMSPPPAAMLWRPKRSTN